MNSRLWLSYAVLLALIANQALSGTEPNEVFNALIYVSHLVMCLWI